VQAKKIIEEAQAEAIRIKANAHPSADNPGLPDTIGWFRQDLRREPS
jgi:hypothetical protein